MHCQKNIFRWSVLVAGLSLLFAGCAETPKAVDHPVGVETEWQITPEAQITQFNWKIGEHDKSPSLIFTAALKNVGTEPLRYRLNIFLLDSDKAAGHLIPRTGKPPLLEPGKTESVTIPFINSTDPPKNLLVVVKTVGY